MASPSFLERLEAAKAEVMRLELQIKQGNCEEVGHDWVSIGGCGCGCKKASLGYSCSVPVNECRKCGDCDYGQNDDADTIRASCEAEDEDV